MKKKIIIISVTVIVVLAAAFCLWKFVFADTATPGAEEEKIAVSSVAAVTGIGSGVGLETRFSGLVEPQKTLDIKKDADKKVSSLFVTEGATVKAGDKLFKYDTDDIAMKLEQTKLEVETIANKIQTLNNQISDLKKERSNAPSSEELTYTLQIQSLELDVKTEEYNKTTKANEAEKIEKSLSNTTVTSEIAGIVKSINSTDKTDQSGAILPYISILSTGNYRVKCTISELNINAISQGQSMIVHSRLDSEQIWKGTIETIDRENTVQNQNNGGMMRADGNGDAGATASKYHFYVTLDNFDGLILGQHVYAELDFGQSEKKEGLWLPSAYLVSDGGKSFVWVRNDKEKLERRQVTLGEQDAEMDTFQITDGLEVSNFIAFPQENLKNGMATMEGDSFMNGAMGGSMGGSVTPEGRVTPEGEAIPDDIQADIGGAIINGGGDVATKQIIGGATAEAVG